MPRARAARRQGGGAVSSGGQAGTQVGNVYPQTTLGGDNFIERSRIAERTGYFSAMGTGAWGSAIDQQLAAAPGYYRYLDLTLFSNAGVASAAGGLATGYVGVDAGVSPLAAIQQLLFRDAAGNTIYSLTDPLALYLINMFSGQSGVLQAADLANLPSRSTSTGGGVSTAAATNGNFLAHARIPFEIAHGTAYGTIAAGAANLQPSLHMAFQPITQLLATAPGTLPALSVQVDENYWAAVPGDQPPDLGTSLQWQQLTANPAIANSSGNKITLGKTEGFITTLILIFRDLNNQRKDDIIPGGTAGAAPYGLTSVSNNRLQLWVDTVLVLDEDINTRMDQMYFQFPGLTVSSHRVGPVGVLVYTFRNSVSQAVLGPDSGELWTPSTPGTLLEIGAGAWGATTNSPTSITALIGSIVPGPEGIQVGVQNIVP